MQISKKVFALVFKILGSKKCDSNKRLNHSHLTFIYFLVFKTLWSEKVSTGLIVFVCIQMTT